MSNMKLTLMLQSALVAWLVAFALMLVMAQTASAVNRQPSYLPLTADHTGGFGPFRCYQCNSEQQHGCDTNVTARPEWLKTCPSFEGRSAVGCWLLKQKVKYSINEELTAHDRVFRKCAYHQLVYHSDCLYRAGFGGEVTHCFCNTTACNPATNVESSSLLTALSMVLTVATSVWYFRA